MSKLLVHAFINSKLDYCNSVLYDIGVVHLRNIQSDQNRAAQVVIRKQIYGQITSTLETICTLYL